jgi:hypothetical protein
LARSESGSKIEINVSEFRTYSEEMDLLSKPTHRVWIITITNRLINYKNCNDYPAKNFKKGSNYLFA